MVFKLLNNQLIIETYSDNLVKTFKGLRVLAVDGSTTRLPISKELYEVYGSDVANMSVPLARTSVIFDVLNGITLDANINPYNASERSLAIEHIIEIGKQDQCLNNKSHTGDIILFDRGYPSLPLMFFLQNKKKHFLIRTSNVFLSEVIAVVNAGLRDSVIIIPAFKKGRDNSPLLTQCLPDLDKNASIQIRVLVFDLNSGQQEIIMTSLLDQEKFSYNDIFDLYALRWNVEECYKFYKSIAEMENFSGKSKLAIEQDFFATIFTCNISSLLMHEAQEELNQANTIPNEAHESTDKIELKYEYKVNRNILIGIIKNEIIDVFLSNQDLDEYCNRLKARIKKNLVPIRPDRKYPRVFKRARSVIDKRAL
jgi:hypothetical protein